MIKNGKRARAKKTASPPRRNVNVPAADLPALIEGQLGKDFRASFNWRVLRIMAEFVEGWNFLADVNRSVTIFGSARFKPDNKWYREARKLGRLLTDRGFNVVTGGGPGIMEAANRGAVEGDHNGDSYGLNISLPFEDRMNPYVTKGIGFHYFFVRKVMLAYSAQAYVFFPGGLGTLDEFTELVTLIQTKRVSVKIPVILVGKDFWAPFIGWIGQTLRDEYKVVSGNDMKIYQVVDTAEEALSIIRKSPERVEFG